LVLKNYVIKGIWREGERSYQVFLENDEGGEVSFEFTISEGTITVVEYADAFAAFVQHRTGPLGLLFEAVLRFHEAAQIRIDGLG